MAVCGALMSATGILLATSGQAAGETVTIVFDDSNGFRPSSAQIPYAGRVSWTNAGGVRVRIHSVSGPCNFNISVDPFSSSAPAGPYVTPGRCDYKGETLLGTSAATLVFAPKPSPSPTPTAKPSPTPTTKPTPTPTTTAKPTTSPTAAPSESPSPRPTGSRSPSPSPTEGATRPTPTPTTTPGPSATTSPPAPIVGFNLPDSGRRNLGLPSALAAVLLAALTSAIARVLSAEGRRVASHGLGDRAGVR